MADAPINLNRARKQRARDAAKRSADQNAVKHGRTRAERELEAARKVLAEKRLDGHGRDDD